MINLGASKAPQTGRIRGPDVAVATVDVSRRAFEMTRALGSTFPSRLSRLLLIALFGALLASVSTAAFAAVAAALALPLIVGLRSSAVAGKQAALIAAVIEVPARYVSLATGSRASRGRECRLEQPLAR